MAGPRNQKKEYLETCVEHYRPLWSNGINVDVIGEDSALDPYKLVIAPMLYLLRPGVAQRFEQFVQRGGTLIATYLSGIVNESDLCFLSGFPGPLRKLMGIRVEETDTLYDEEHVAVVPSRGNDAGLSKIYSARHYCDLLHAEGAQVLATYGGEFYKGRPALTRNVFGRGAAYYIASRNDRRFHDDFYAHLIEQLGLRRALDTRLPDGVTAVRRGEDEKQFVFLIGFNRGPVTVDLGRKSYRDVLSGQRITGKIRLPRYSGKVLEPLPQPVRAARTKRRRKLLSSRWST